MPTQPVPNLPRDFVHVTCGAPLRLSYRDAVRLRDGKLAAGAKCACEAMAKPLELKAVKAEEPLEAKAPEAAIETVEPEDVDIEDEELS